MLDIHFKTFHTQDFNSKELFIYNKKVLTLNLNKIVFSNPKNSLKSLFQDDKTLFIMNEYIFELLGTDNIQYYKTGTKLTERCLYDDKPQGYPKSQNREYIQDIIRKRLLRNDGYMDDFENELITLHLEVEGWKFKCEDGEEFNSKEELDEHLDNLDDGVDEYLSKQEIDEGEIDENEDFINYMTNYTPVDELPPPVDELITSEECSEDEKTLQNAKIIEFSK